MQRRVPSPRPLTGAAAVAIFSNVDADRLVCQNRLLQDAYLREGRAIRFESAAGRAWGPMICSNCGTENRAEAKFCDGCGATLARACPECGSVVRPQAKFCDECSSPLDGSQRAAENRSAGRPAEVPRGTERRLVSVLFADLGGFTTLSEARDSEEVRDLLSRYFDTCRTVIARYGGVVEKFIGDAVMAVWGAPVTMEDDAERAVRAAIDLTEAVTGLGEQVGAPGLRARAGVLTGEATVNLGATGEGM